MGNFEPAPGSPGNLRCAERCVVAADGHKVIDPKLFDAVHGAPEVFFIAGWIGAGSPKDGTALRMDPGNVRDVQRPDHVGSASRQMLKTVTDTHHRQARIYCLNHRSADRAVDARGGSATDENSHTRCFIHASIIPS